MGRASPTRTEIAPREVAARRDDDRLFVLDVRNEDDYEEWAVGGSHNVPIYDELLDGELSGLEAALDELPKEKEIAVICVGGVTSAHAAEFLRERGYEARSVSDGMRGWGRVHRTYDVESEPGVLQVVRPGTGCVSYLVHDGDEAVIVDPSQYVDRYREIADEVGVDVVGAIDTHAHADHVSGGREIAGRFDVPYYLHEADAGSLDDYTPIGDGDRLPVGVHELDVVHTPGHTPGSVSLVFGDAVLSGDTLFLRSVGRPDLEDGREEAVRDAASDLFDSLRRLGELPGETVVLPGHFSDEESRPLATTLERLKTDNELFEMVADGDEETFVDSIVEALSDTPNNYERIKHINWGDEPLDDDAEALELGPNNCAAN